MLLAVVGVAVVAAGVWRAKHMRDMTRITLTRRVLGADGIVVGGEGFVLDRPGAPAVLLLHGGGDTPQTLRYLATELHTRGFHVAAPLLPGHGRSLRDFTRVTADQLIEATEREYRALRASHDWVAVIGLSMGGALAVHLAAGLPELPALGLVAPYLGMPPGVERAARLAWLWGLFVPAVRSGDTASIRDPEELSRSLAYGVFTAAALRALRNLKHRAVEALPRVAAPTLIIQSRSDNRIASADTERAFALLGATEKRIEWITDAGHVITVDFGREHVIDTLAAWMEAHAPIRVNKRERKTAGAKPTVL
jgi:carboxylesterase